MAMDWTKIYKQYKGLWVAIKDDEKTVIGKGKTAKEALADSMRNGYKKPILNFVPKELVHFAGNEISL